MGALLLLGSSRPAFTATNDPLGAYQAGDRAREDIITPVALFVFDPDETELQRQKEIKRTPLIFRFESQAHARAVESMGAEILSVKTAFLKALGSNFNRQVLVPKMVEGNRFNRLVSGFRRQHQPFPLPSALAEAWALDQSDADMLTEWTNRLSGAFAGYIRPNSLGEEFKNSPGSMKILDPARTGSNPDLDEALRAGVSWQRTNTLTLAKARLAFQNSFTNEAPALGKFLAKFIVPNLRLDETLTRQWRARRIQRIWAADPYDAGTRLAARGGEITPKIKRALDELSLLTGAERLKTDLAREQSKVRLTQELLRGRTEAQHLELEVVKQYGYWTLSSVALAFLVMLALAVWGRRRRRWRPLGTPRTLMPAATVLDGALQPITLACPSCKEPVPIHVATHSVAQSWQRRALEAERRAAAAMALMRSKLMPGLFGWAKSKLMRALVSQRDQLAHHQWVAEKEINELARRLDQVQTPMAGRLKAYESRIAQLEEQLRIKGEENRALIQARLQAARRQLALEQNAGTIGWN